MRGLLLALVPLLLVPIPAASALATVYCGYGAVCAVTDIQCQTTGTGVVHKYCTTTYLNAIVYGCATSPTNVCADAKVYLNATHVRQVCAPLVGCGAPVDQPVRGFVDSFGSTNGVASVLFVPYAAATCAEGQGSASVLLYCFGCPAQMAPVPPGGVNGWTLDAKTHAENAGGSAAFAPGEARWHVIG